MNINPFSPKGTTPTNKSWSTLLQTVALLSQINQYFKDCFPGQQTLANHCYVIKKTNGNLTLLVDNAHWVIQLRFQLPDLIKKLRTFPELHDLQTIDLKVRPRPAPLSSAPPPTRPPVQLSAQNAALLRDTAKTISDPKLKAILDKIAKRNSLSH